MPAAPGGFKALRVPAGHAERESAWLVAGHFVGRAGELGSLERILDGLDRGDPGAVQVAGEPGIGNLRNIFHKIGVTTRTALAHTVERTDPTTRPPLSGSSATGSLGLHHTVAPGAREAAGGSCVDACLARDAQWAGDG